MLYPIIILALLIIVLGLVFYILYLKFSKKYTREKFAFFSVTSIVSLASSFLVQIKQSTDSISAFQVVYNSVFSAHLEVHRTVVEDHILFAIIVISLIILIYGLHRNWNGPVSELYFERKIHSETPPTLIDESFLQLADFFRKNKAIKVHIDNERGKKYNVFTPYEDEKMPWYESVFELLSYADRQYKIDINKDYYQDDKVLLSKYGQSNQSIAIFCSLDTPKESAIRNFILFCRKQKDVYSKYIIAIKNERAETKIENHLGVDIHFRYESEMLDSLIDVSNYRQYIRDQY
ncbi:MAG TPA: hypothetical protein VFF57_06735, partial [Hanamia sp.]|nr:hypothetical protein [Hanamia sp.]